MHLATYVLCPSQTSSTRALASHRFLCLSSLSKLHPEHVIPPIALLFPSRPPYKRPAQSRADQIILYLYFIPRTYFQPPPLFVNSTYLLSLFSLSQFRCTKVEFYLRHLILSHLVPF
jgi:hypothetical protein